MLVRVIDGVLRKGQTIRMIYRREISLSSAPAISRPDVQADEIGSAKPSGFIAAFDQARWPTLAPATPPTAARAAPQAGFKLASRWCSAARSRSTPLIFEGFRRCRRQLRTNDASFSYEMETSRAGLRLSAGFGLLHLEIIQSG